MHDADRSQALLEAFRERFGVKPSVLVAAPGRVNLIGEHTDYNGLPVLPMAIDRRITIAAAACPEATIRLENMDPAYGPRSYELAAPIPPFAGGDWGNYHKAAVQGIIDHFGGGARGAGAASKTGGWSGGLFLAGGDIPAGAGLSSSSALVVAAALAFLAVNGVRVPATRLAELLPRAERYVGTLSGGMDQATSLLARAGHALRIDFFPLRVRPVRLPEGVAVVVCHSLVRAEKSAGARDAYNRRVIECRLACRALERALGTALPRRLGMLGDLVELFPARPLATFVPALAHSVPEGPLALPQIGACLGLSEERLRRECEIPAAMRGPFVVVERGRHVLAEADRVNAAERALEGGDAAALGELMFASHASCRDDYQVSCAELDELAASARKAGALGARLTGAGFGGCTVNLVRAEDLRGFLETIDGDFYAPRLGTAEDAARHRFVLRASGAAGVTRLDEAPAGEPQVET